MSIIPKLSDEDADILVDVRDAAILALQAHGCHDVRLDYLWQRLLLNELAGEFGSRGTDIDDNLAARFNAALANGGAPYRLVKA